MTLHVVGTGLGRTGTKSMQSALNLLGLGPCHHMMEMFEHPESMPLWITAGAGRPDWGAIFENYRSVVDYPGSAFWREITTHYPQAKVIHTVRDPDAWFESTQSTIFAPGRAAAAAAGEGGVRGDFFRVVVRDIGDHLHDRAFMTDYFEKHTQAVVSTIPAERLLIYHVGEGWDRLCAFLEVPVPELPYPSENTRSDFAARQAEMAAQRR